MSKRKGGRPIIQGVQPRIQARDLTDGQTGATKVYRRWLKKEKNAKTQVLRIGGGAGAGKSFWLRHIIEVMGFDMDNCMVMAYTGQATNVLRSGGISAKTIHSSIMQLVEQPAKDADGKPIERRGIPVMTSKFVPLKELPPNIKQIFIDESSFLPKALERTVKSYGVPIVELGDPEQLPPVGGDPAFGHHNLDYFIEGVMRQKAGSRLYKYIHAIRKNKKNLDPMDYFGPVTILKGMQHMEDAFFRYFSFIESADIIICGTNKQRQMLTDLWRKYVIKTDSPYPVKGEKLICRKNDFAMMIAGYSMVNGTQGYCRNTVGRGMIDVATKSFNIDFNPVFLDRDHILKDVTCDADYLTMPFGAEKHERCKYNPAMKMEYAHAITAHLAQGASWGNVVFFDSYMGPDQDYHRKVVYTACSRATKSLVHILPFSRW